MNKFHALGAGDRANLTRAAGETTADTSDPGLFENARDVARDDARYAAIGAVVGLALVAILLLVS